MSTAVLERIVEQPKSLVAVAPAPQPEKMLVVQEMTAAAQEAPVWSDPHPLLPVFVAGAISLVLAGGFIGSILVWLAVRYSGIIQ